MADEDALHDLYARTLEPRLKALEGLRLSLRSYIVKSGILIGIPGAIVYFRELITMALPAAWEWPFTIVSFAALFAGVLIAGVKFLLPGITAYANYKGRFKQEVVSEVFKLVCPTATYSPEQGIAQNVFVGSGIFNDTGSYSSDDRVRGHIGKTPFEAGEVHRKYSSGGKNSRTYTVFRGLFFHFDFNKALRGVTIVQPEDAPGYQIGSRSGLVLASFENPDFEKVFKVYTSNEVEARYVLTPAMMEQLLAVRAHADRPIFLAFRDNSAYLGIQYGRALFEPGIADTTSKAAILEMAEHFGLAGTIVGEMDLNTRIWTKDVDESLLQQPDRKPTGFMDMPEARAGTLTQKALWDKAVTAVGDDYADEAGKIMPKPDRTRIRIGRDEGRWSVRYGWSISFVIFLLLSLAAAAIVLSAIKQLGVASVPTVPRFDALVGENGIVWLPVAAVIGGFCTLGWLVRVRRVDVTSDTVLVYRGFRPMPRRYARSEFDEVMRMKNSVHLKRSASSTIFYPTASPNLSEAEAAWVASEMRQALQ